MLSAATPITIVQHTNSISDHGTQTQQGFLSASRPYIYGSQLVQYRIWFKNPGLTPRLQYESVGSKYVWSAPGPRDPPSPGKPLTGLQGINDNEHNDEDDAFKTPHARHFFQPLARPKKGVRLTCPALAFTHRTMYSRGSWGSTTTTMMRTTRFQTTQKGGEGHLLQCPLTM